MPIIEQRLTEFELSIGGLLRTAGVWDTRAARLERADSAPLLAAVFRRSDGDRERHAVGFSLLARLVPVISFDLLDYAAGLSRVPWLTFVGAIGISPLTAASVTLGEQLVGPRPASRFPSNSLGAGMAPTRSTLHFGYEKGSSA